MPMGETIPSPVITGRRSEDSNLIALALVGPEESDVSPHLASSLSQTPFIPDSPNHSVFSNETPHLRYQPALGSTKLIWSR
jgi:hypothetical protein